jgi:hypothetical protein
MYANQVLKTGVRKDLGVRSPRPPASELSLNSDSSDSLFILSWAEGNRICR